jgi:ribose 5-phosphate isomerase B
MVIYIGADHRGFETKEHLFGYLRDQGYEVDDVGAHEKNADDDYPDFAIAVAHKLEGQPDATLARGVLVCGSGVGVAMVANKFKHVRAALGFNSDQVYAARHDDDVNVLCIPSDFVSVDDAEKLLKVFLSTPFAREERFLRRIQKIDEL